MPPITLKLSSKTAAGVTPSKRPAPTNHLAADMPSSAGTTVSQSDQPAPKRSRTRTMKPEPQYKIGDWGFVRGKLFSSHRFQISKRIWSAQNSNWNCRIKNNSLIPESTVVYIEEGDFLPIRFQEGERFRKKLEGTDVVAVGMVKQVILESSGNIRHVMSFAYEREIPEDHDVNLDSLLESTLGTNKWHEWSLELTLAKSHSSRTVAATRVATRYRD